MSGGGNETSVAAVLGNGTITDCIPAAVRYFGVAYYAPLMLIGCCANAAVVVVMRHTRSLSQSSDIFTVLAVADTCVLLVNPARYLALLALNYDFRVHSTAMCILHTFLTYYLKEAATWVLVLMTLERFLFTRWPHKSNLYYRRRPKLIVWASTGLLLLAKNIILLFKLRLSNNQCESDDPSFRTRFFVATLTVYSLVPFLLLVVFNITLVRLLTRAARLRRAMSIVAQNCDAARAAGDGGGGRSGSHNSGRAVTRLLIPICLLHILLTLPQCAFETAEAVSMWKADQSICRQVQTAGYLLVMLASLNNGINGFAYFFSSRHFRANFRRLVGRRRSVVVGGRRLAGFGGGGGGDGGGGGGQALMELTNTATVAARDSNKFVSHPASR